MREIQDDGDNPMRAVQIISDKKQGADVYGQTAAGTLDLNVLMLGAVTTDAGR